MPGTNNNLYFTIFTYLLDKLQYFPCKSTIFIYLPKSLKSRTKQKIPEQGCHEFNELPRMERITCVPTHANYFISIS